MDRNPVDRTIRATPAAVWAVLADGWAYANWVVGASAIRDVDATWPSPGSRIHHSVGSWPLLLSDTTSVKRSEPEALLELQARGWPLGEATVEVRLEPVPEGTRVTILEDVSEGPGRFLPAPLRTASIVPRNRESLRRLALVAENRRR
ncbi:polyketide cyclase/dehydrase/lipid transport protein [Motilibacter rhizosphaerae]|uniref:Polyketide cyclase/dehydrase/lipid transport protein n=1 Tax=Motilibacter rhizosphaerae TaxID=598652 RepID=A0A4Q7NWP2_9ACTN|nr:SRPBCC family protein [Motilibacter rhizosphaerae]RZS91746.1 polyketide cyclase/dehydrase/lipid transport protein [Motilibacter rhizosphaerae]